MFKDDIRETIKFIVIVVVIAIVLFFASILIFFKADSSSRNNINQMKQTVKQKTPITNIEQTYHLSRDVNSYALKGTSKTGKKYYFIYLPNSKKAVLYEATKGVSQSKIEKIFKKTHSDQEIRATNLGWYKNKAVWEVAFQNSKNRLGYSLYDFHNGKAINEVDNL